MLFTADINNALRYLKKLDPVYRGSYIIMAHYRDSAPTIAITHRLDIKRFVYIGVLR